MCRRGSAAPGSAAADDGFAREPRLKVAADTCLYAPEFTAQLEGVFHWKPTTGQYDYKNRGEEFKARAHLPRRRRRDRSSC